MGAHTHYKVLLSATLVSCSLALMLSAGRSRGMEWDGTWRHHERQAPSHEIISLFALPDGRIAAGCANSFHVYEQGQWKKTVFEPSMLTNHAPFFSDSAGKVYFLDNNRLVTWDRGKVTRHESVELYEPLSAWETPDGTILFGSYNYEGAGLYTFAGETLAKINDGRVRSIAVDTLGGIWATLIPPGGSTLHLVYRGSGGWVDRNAEIEQLFPVIDINLLIQSAPDGSVWVTNEGKYGVYREGKWSFTNNMNGANPIALAFDRSGRVWGYSARTLYLLKTAGNWTISRNYQSFMKDGPGFITVGPDSEVYTFDTDTVYRWSGVEWVPLENRFDLGSDRVTCLSYLKNGWLVCGHGFRGVPFEQQEHRGLSVFDGTRWTNFNKDGSSLFPDVYVLKRSPEGEIVIYSNEGYYFYDGRGFDPLDSLKVFDTTDIAWDSAGKMWLTTNRGLVQFSNPVVSGFYSPPEMFDPWGGLYNLCIDDQDYLYMQAIYGHVLYTDREKFYLMISDPGRVINDIAVEGNGTVWGARITDLSWWNTLDKEWRTVVEFPDSNRLVSIDPQGRIWSSCYGETGYLENWEFHTFPELSKTASDIIAFSDEGCIALNAFDRDRREYSGIYEYYPLPVNVDDTLRPEPFILANAYPNPFNLATTIQFVIPFSEKVKIDVYNVSGQRVITLADGMFTAGTHQVVWNARSDGGAAASSGIYLFKIEAGKRTKIGKLLLLK